MLAEKSLASIKTYESFRTLCELVVRGVHILALTSYYPDMVSEIEIRASVRPSHNFRFKFKEASGGLRKAKVSRPQGIQCILKLVSFSREVITLSKPCMRASIPP
jgi:hypothetical protein